MISIKQHASDAIVMAGLDTIRRLGIGPIKDPAYLLEAINEVVFAGIAMPPQLGVQIFRLIATLEAHGLSKE